MNSVQSGGGGGGGVEEDIKVGRQSVTLLTQIDTSGVSMTVLSCVIIVGDNGV